MNEHPYGSLAYRLTESRESLSQQLKHLVHRRSSYLTTEDIESIKTLPLPLTESTVPREAPYHLSDEDKQLVDDVYENEKKPKIYYDDPLEQLDNMTYVELPSHIVFAVYLRMYWGMFDEGQKGLHAEM